MNITEGGIGGYDVLMAAASDPSLILYNTKSKKVDRFIQDITGPVSTGTVIELLYCQPYNCILMVSTTALWKCNLDTLTVDVYPLSLGVNDAQMNEDSTKLILFGTVNGNIGASEIDIETLSLDGVLIDDTIAFPSAAGSVFGCYTKDFIITCRDSTTSTGKYLRDGTYVSSDVVLPDTTTIEGVAALRNHPDGDNYYALVRRSGNEVIVINGDDDSIVYSVNNFLIDAAGGRIIEGQAGEIIVSHEFTSNHPVTVIDYINDISYDLEIPSWYNGVTDEPNGISISTDKLTLDVSTDEGVFRFTRSTLNDQFTPDENFRLYLSIGQYTTLQLKGIATTWEIKGDIDENVAESEWVCQAIDIETNTVSGEVITSGNSFTIPVTTPKPCRVYVAPTLHTVWDEAEIFGIGDRVYPTDPETNPYYYECTTSGITSTTEPAWPVTSGSTVVDGSVVWTLVEKVIQPVMHSPIVPTVATGN